ncbi:MAG: hypothetical protein HY514_02030 [Candidatus Aenigmarchaeota archaeon]|nr:hypothetical protein [Candidatus Aenigmarchaeota archaeon]
MSEKTSVFLRPYEVLRTWRHGRLEALRRSIEAYGSEHDLSQSDTVALAYVNSALQASRRRLAMG